MLHHHIWKGSLQEDQSHLNNRRIPRYCLSTPHRSSLSIQLPPTHSSHPPVWACWMRGKSLLQTYHGGMHDKVILPCWPGIIHPLPKTCWGYTPYMVKQRQTWYPVHLSAEAMNAISILRSDQIGSKLQLEPTRELSGYVSDGIDIY